jgi:hypothetical protein
MSGGRGRKSEDKGREEKTEILKASKSDHETTDCGTTNHMTMDKRKQDHGHERLHKD